LTISRHSSETCTPGCIPASTILSYSAALHFRRFPLLRRSALAAGRLKVLRIPASGRRRRLLGSQSPCRYKRTNHKNRKARETFWGTVLLSRLSASDRRNAEPWEPKHGLSTFARD
jgi:hypothetical protein